MPGKTRRLVRSAHGRNRASMRPQRNAGENGGSEHRRLGRRQRASMRPQRNAGENGTRNGSEGSSSKCFNEAPAKCRGKHCIAKETKCHTICFNEAPAKCRGKLAPRRDRRPPPRRFNEAPAKCRGKPNKVITNGILASASMRPQRNAGEN